MRHLLPGTILLAACATAPAAAPAPATPADAAAAFVRAVEGRDWERAYGLLSARWRARLTPARLAADWEAGGALAADRLTRARLALAEEPVAAGDEARFPIGAGQELRLVRESGRWRIDALE